MNKTHRILVDTFKKINQEHSIYNPNLDNLCDEKFIHLLFLNFRGQEETAKGLRLTYLGLELMQKCFEHFEIKRNDIFPTYRELIYLDTTSKLPYFISKNKIVVFEKDLAVYLMMTDGILTNL